MFVLLMEEEGTMYKDNNLGSQITSSTDVVQ
jgi:hypothetical protein